MAKIRRKAKLENKKLYDLIRQYPEILPILDRYGISFCAGCFLTLDKTPKEAAAYHGAMDAQKFLRDLSRAILKRS